MKYADYSIEDFACDEYFQTWVWGSDPMVDNFWQQWTVSNPEKRGDLEKAKKLVLLLDMERHELSVSRFDLMWRNVIERRGREAYPIKKSPKKNRLVLFKIAAVFVGLISIGIGLYSSGFFEYDEQNGLVPESAITLESEDGTITVIEESATMTLRDKFSGATLRQEKNTIMYEQNAELEEIVFNQLTVPLGKKFELVLSDGTHVFLNSGTKLRYPVSFLSGHPRDVYLDGEAYFEVEKDSMHAFTVITDDLNTRVYGTSFNVSSYKNDKNTSTVLVEGSVGVYLSKNTEGREPTILAPGQQASFVDEVVEVRNVDVRKYKAWTEGKLFFTEDRFDIVVKELQRHFDVSIENNYSELNDIMFTGTFEDESLDQILTIFQEHTPFDYEEKGNEIVIHKSITNE